MALQYILHKIKTPNHYVIDIGASTGGGPAFEFLSNPQYSGLAIEYSASSIPKLKETIANPKVSVFQGKATPSSICSIFQTHSVPFEPDLLKIDIDGYDLMVLRALLQNYKPKVLVAEINEKIPPPISFEVKYSEEYSWDGSHFFGFSLQAAKETLEPFGYSLVGILNGNNLLCVSKDHFRIDVRNIQEIYEQDYSKNSTILPHYPWNADVHFWTTITDKDVLKAAIFDYFTTKNPRGKPVSADLFILK